MKASFQLHQCDIREGRLVHSEDDGSSSKEEEENAFLSAHLTFNGSCACTSFLHTFFSHCHFPPFSIFLFPNAFSYMIAKKTSAELILSCLQSTYILFILDLISLYKLILFQPHLSFTFLFVFRLGLIQCDSFCAISVVFFSSSLSSNFIIPPLSFRFTYYHENTIRMHELSLSTSNDPQNFLHNNHVYIASRILHS